jgi:hypothetical protein
MPTTRKKKSSKKVSILEPVTVEVAGPCPLCGRCGPIDTTQMLLRSNKSVSQVEPPEPPTAVTAENLSQEIDAAFDALDVQLPPSVRKRISSRLLKKGLSPSCPEGVEVVRLACQAYLAKKERAKAASAARRAATRHVVSVKEADTQQDQQADVTA